MKPALELVHDHAGAVAAGVVVHERRAGDVADELLSLLGAAGHRRVKREAVADCGAVLNTRARPTRFGGRAPSADGAIGGRPRASLLDHARARVLARAGARFQERMEARVMGAILTRLGRSPAARSAPAAGETAARAGHFVEQLRAGAETVRGLGMRTPATARGGAPGRRAEGHGGGLGPGRRLCGGRPSGCRAERGLCRTEDCGSNGN